MHTFLPEKLYYQYFGNVFIIGIQADTEQSITERYFSFFNHGATSGEFVWVEKSVPPFLGYFWTSPKKLKKGLVNAMLFRLCSEEGHEWKGKRGGLWQKAQAIADEILSKIEKKRIL